MTGSKPPELIIPGKKIPAYEARKVIIERQSNEREGHSLIETEFTNMEQELEPYLHENTKYYLNTVVSEITPFLSQQQLMEIVKVLCNTFNCVCSFGFESCF